MSATQILASADEAMTRLADTSHRTAFPCNENYFCGSLSQFGGRKDSPQLRSEKMPKDLSSVDKPAQSEVHSTYIKLTWQNVFSAVLVVGGLTLTYANLNSKIESYHQQSESTDKLLSQESEADRALAAQHIKVVDDQIKNLSDIASYHREWLQNIAVKTAVPPPSNKGTP